MADKKDDKAAKAEEKPVRKKPVKRNPLNEAGWNAFGAVLLAGFALIVIAMGEASYFKPGIATVITLVGGLVIFALSAMFAKMAVTEFGRAIAETLRAAGAEKEPDAEEEKSDRKNSR